MDEKGEEIELVPPAARTPSTSTARPSRWPIRTASSVQLVDRQGRKNKLTGESS